MPDVTLYGFPRSTYVNVARLTLAAKGVPYTFHDTETEMYGAAHLERHPFRRVPVLQHGGWWLYETSAIALYVDEAFAGPALQPRDPRERARMHQWISSLNAYFYPYMVHYLVHERVVFPELGIAPVESIVKEALPKVERALAVLEQALEDGRPYVVAAEPTLADIFLLPTLTSLGFAPEGKALLEGCPHVRAWLARMAAWPVVAQYRASLPPRAPIEHARRWAVDHRPLVS